MNKWRSKMDVATPLQELQLVLYYEKMLHFHWSWSWNKPPSSTFTWCGITCSSVVLVPLRRSSWPSSDVRQWRSSESWRWLCRNRWGFTMFSVYQIWSDPYPRTCFKSFFRSKPLSSTKPLRFFYRLLLCTARIQKRRTPSSKRSVMWRSDGAVRLNDPSPHVGSVFVLLLRRGSEEAAVRFCPSLVLRPLHAAGPDGTPQGRSGDAGQQSDFFTGSTFRYFLFKDFFFKNDTSENNNKWWKKVIKS